MRLIPCREADFDWMLGRAPGRPGLRLPPGGVDTPEAIGIVRTIHRAVGGRGRPGAWLIVVDDEVVGLCGQVRLAGNAAVVEIGYNVAPRRRRRGHAGRAVAILAEMILTDPAIAAVTAVTAADNGDSQGVLRRNEFVAVGREVRDEDGAVILWRRDRSAPPPPPLG